MRRMLLGKFSRLVLCVTALAATVGMAAPAVAAPGANSTTLAASKTLDICTPDAGATWIYSGEISVWNEGAVDTQNLTITDCIQNSTGGPEGGNTYCSPTDFSITSIITPTPTVIPAGTTKETATTFIYTYTGDPLPGTIRNVAQVEITNPSGALGTPTGPEPKATWMGVVPSCAVECGCVGTLGYWLTHPEAWPAGHDPSAPCFLSEKTWLAALDPATPGTAGNGYYILARQYIAAVLNQAHNACVPLGVQQLLDSAAQFFYSSTPASCLLASSCGLQKTWAGMLNDYNNGNYPNGPAQCE